MATYLSLEELGFAALRGVVDGRPEPVGLEFVEGSFSPVGVPFSAMFLSFLPSPPNKE
jgi:hypothetical protein